LIQPTLAHCVPDFSETIKIQSEDIQINSIPSDIDRGFIVAFLPKAINRNNISLSYSTDMEKIFAVLNVLESEKIFYARKFKTPKVMPGPKKPNNRILDDRQYQSFYYKGDHNKYLTATSQPDQPDQTRYISTDDDTTTQVYPYAIIFKSAEVPLGVAQYSFQLTTIVEATGHILQKDQISVYIKGNMWNADSKYLLDPKKSPNDPGKFFLIDNETVQCLYLALLVNYMLPITIFGL
jgi:hypothetical protein